MNNATATQLHHRLQFFGLVAPHLARLIAWDSLISGQVSCVKFRAYHTSRL